MRLMKAAGVLLLTIQISWATFDPTRWNFGADWDFLSKNMTGSVATSVDYVSIWLNDATFNTYWHGDMLRFCKSNNKTPVFYAYMVAKASGLGDADVGGKLDAEGGKWLRGNLNAVKQRYENYAQQAANVYGTDKPIIWLMEPDYFQYCNGNDGNSYSDAAGWMNDFIGCVKKYLPNALFSLDISPWNNDQANYIRAFDMTKFSFMNTSGGRTEAGNDRIRLDNNNNVTWSAVKSASGKCIIADDGYGTGGTSTGHDATWDDLNNIKSRISNGVVAITQKSPKTDWGSTISSLKSSLSSTSCNCGVVMPKASFSITITAPTNGKVTKSPDAATYDSGATVTLTAVPNTGYNFKSWGGDVSGTSTTTTVTMNANKTVSATFVDPNAKPTYTLTVTTTGSGVVQLTPDKVEFDSGSTVTLQALVANGATFSGWGGALSGLTPNTTLVMNGNKTVTASFTGNNIEIKNLVKGGNFSGGATDWTFGAYDPAKATGGITGGAYQIAIQTTGTENWHVQFMQAGISLTKDEKYELTFYASAQSGTTMVINIGMPVDPFTSYSQNKTFTLTATREKYSAQFIMRQPSTTTARLEFDCGKSSGTILLDDITLSTVVELGSVAPERMLFKHDELNGIGNTDRVSISWYDHTGRLLRSMSGEYGTIAGRKGFNLPGSYIAVVRAGSRQMVRRVVTVGR